MKATKDGIGIVIPCFNEEKRLPLNAFKSFLSQYKNGFIVFVDDGSFDYTLSVLDALQKEFPENVYTLIQHQNQGKAAAVRSGIHYLLEHTPVERLGFLDADLSTSLEEGYSLGQQLDTTKEFIFGSRILKLDNTIERKWYRFIIGRFVASVISKMLTLKVYDTQCGCKFFSRLWAESAFQKPFLSRWLFDVEVFYRLLQHFGKKEFLRAAQETPLQRWIDQGDSRISWSYGFKMWWDLFLIWRHYKH